jgi:hypothetical protein
MTPEVRAELSAALLAVVDGFNELIQRLFSLGPGADDSRASMYVEEDFSQVTTFGSDPVGSATRSLLFSALAGLDHVRTFAHGLVVEHPAFSLATLTRGAVEAYARAYWQMTAPDATTFLQRWLSGISKEYAVAISINPDTHFLRSTGGVDRAVDVQEGVLGDLERLTGSKKPIVVNYTTLATELVSKFNAGARAHYSHLSAVAHGESLGIQAFVGTDDAEGGFLVALPERWGMFYVEEVFNATTITLRELLNFMGWAESESDPWAAAHLATLDLIKREHQRIFGEPMGSMA